MAVAAIKAKPADVMRVAERDRLKSHRFCRSHIRRTIDDNERPAAASEDEQRTKNTHFRESVEASMKGLRHQRHLDRRISTSAYDAAAGVAFVRAKSLNRRLPGPLLESEFRNLCA